MASEEEQAASKRVRECCMSYFVACLLKEGQLLESACRNGWQGQRTCFRSLCKGKLASKFRGVVRPAMPVGF